MNNSYLRKYFRVDTGNITIFTIYYLQITLKIGTNEIVIREHFLKFIYNNPQFVANSGVFHDLWVYRTGHIRFSLVRNFTESSCEWWCICFGVLSQLGEIILSQEISFTSKIFHAINLLFTWNPLLFFRIFALCAISSDPWSFIHKKCIAC